MAILKNIRLALLERRALNAFITGDHARAICHFRQIKTLHPNKPGVDYNIGISALALKRFDEAEKHLTHARDRDQSFAVQRALADLYYLAGRREDAKTAYAAIRRAAPDAKSKGVIERRLRICADEAHYETAMRSWSLLDEAVQLEKAGEKQAAADAYKQAYEADDTNFIAANNYGGHCMNALGDYSRALDYFRRADSLADHPVVKANIDKLEKTLERS